MRSKRTFTRPGHLETTPLELGEERLRAFWIDRKVAEGLSQALLMSGQVYVSLFEEIVTRLRSTGMPAYSISTTTGSSCISTSATAPMPTATMSA